MPLSLLRKSNAHKKSLLILLQAQKTISFPELSSKIELMALMTRHKCKTHIPTNIGTPFFHGINCCGANNGVIKGLVEDACEDVNLKPIKNKIIDPAGGAMTIYSCNQRMAI